MTEISNKTSAWWIGVFFLSCYLLIAGGHYGGDGFWSYLTAESLVLDGDLVLGDRPFLIPEMQNQFTKSEGGGVTGAVGRRHSLYGLGLALLEIPFYLVGFGLAIFLPGIPKDYITMFTVSMTNVFVTATSCVVFFWFASRFYHKRSTLLWITGVFGLGSFAFPYASYGFSEPLLGLCFLGASAGLHHYARHKTASPLVWSGILLGLAVLTKIYSVIAIPIFAGYLWLACKPTSTKELTRVLVCFVAPVCLFGLLVAWYNYARFGGIFKTGYHLVDFSKLDGFLSYSPFYVLTGLYGLLVSSGRGLILFFPAAVLAPLALVRFSRSQRLEALLFASLICEHLLFFAGYINWDGGSSWGPRFLLVILPFLVLPLGSLMEGPDTRKVMVKFLGVLGLLVNLPVTLVNYHFFVRFVLEKQIGTQTHPVSLRSSPLLSPILGSYYQLTSAIHKLSYGSSLTYPIPSAVDGQPASLATYDWFDIWWINALETGFLGTYSTIGLMLCVSLILALHIISVRKIYIWAKYTAGST